MGVLSDAIALELAAGAASVTATADGLTTGLIPALAPMVTVTSDSAAKKISLPAGTIGQKAIQIKIGATGCELIAATAADKANNVTIGATNQLALSANCLYVCEYVATNNWRIYGFDLVGAVLGKTTAALTSITHTAPSTPDYALQDLVQNTGFGFVTKDEGNTFCSVVLNLQLRVLELETAAKLVPDAI